MKLKTKEYVLVCLLSAILLTGFFNEFLFRNFPGHTYVQSRTIIANAIITLSIIGMALNWKNRTLISATLNSTLPLGIITTILYYKTSPVILSVVAALTFMLICTYAVFCFQRVSIRKYFAGALRMVAIGASGFLFVVSMKSVLLDYHIAPNWKTDLLRNMLDNMIITETDCDDVMADLKMLNQFDTQGKINVLQKVYEIESNVLGFDGDGVIVLGDNLEKNKYEMTLGLCENQNKVIKIDLDLLENGQTIDIYNTIVHETRHVYQHHMAEIYQELDEETKKLALYSEVAKWNKNDKTSMEKDCCEYAKQRTELVFAVSDYDESGKRMFLSPSN